MAQSLSLSTRQRQKQALSPAQMLGVRLLEKSLPDLRAEIFNEISSNPVMEDIDHVLETSLSAAEKSAERAEISDYPEDDFVPGTSTDDEAAERRQSFFDNQVKEETLQDHLLAQLPLSNISRVDWPIVEVLVGDLDDSGFYRGSVADVQMAFGKTAEEMDGLFARIQELDPVGCGARTVRECLLAQLDALVENPHIETVRRLIESHLDEVAAGRTAELAKKLGVSPDELIAALSALRTLSPRPGSAYPSERDRVEYVNPEVHAVCRQGHWFAETDERSLPSIRISPKFEAMLKDPNQTEEVRDYIRTHIERAQRFREAVARRQQTIQAIAQATFDHQQDFFTKGFPALAPLTETEIAREVGVVVTTVSRTVRDKYAETPFGVVELRRFFTTGIKTATGVEIAQDAALDLLKTILSTEDPSAPFSDERLAEELRAKGLPLARRTVAKYRDRLGIPSATARRRI